MKRIVKLDESICKRKPMNEILGFGKKGNYKFQILAKSIDNDTKGKWIVLDTVTFPSKKTKEVILAWLSAEAYKYKAKTQSELLVDIKKAYSVNAKKYKIILLSEEEVEYTTDSLKLDDTIKYPKIGKNTTTSTTDEDEDEDDDTPPATRNTSNRNTSRTTVVRRNTDDDEDYSDVIVDSKIVVAGNNLLENIKYSSNNRKTVSEGVGEFLLNLAKKKGDYTFLISGIVQDPVIKKPIWKNLGEYMFDTKKPKDVLKIWLQSIVDGNSLRKPEELLTWLQKTFKLKNDKTFRVTFINKKPDILKVDDVKYKKLKYSKISKMKKTQDSQGVEIVNPDDVDDLDDLN